MKREFHVRFSEGLGLKYPGLLDVCHERTRRQFGGCGVSPEMRVGPSKSAYRSRFQTATSCGGKESSW